VPGDRDRPRPHQTTRDPALLRARRRSARRHPPRRRTARRRGKQDASARHHRHGRSPQKRGLGRRHRHADTARRSPSSLARGRAAPPFRAPSAGRLPHTSRRHLSRRIHASETPGARRSRAATGRPRRAFVSRAATAAPRRRSHTARDRACVDRRARRSPGPGRGAPRRQTRRVPARRRNPRARLRLRPNTHVAGRRSPPSCSPSSRPAPRPPPPTSPGPRRALSSRPPPNAFAPFSIGTRNPPRISRPDSPGSNAAPRRTVRRSART